MEILTLILKIAAVLGLFTLLFLPLRDVSAWDDSAWYARFAVSALATTAWAGLLLFKPGAVFACAIVWGGAALVLALPPESSESIAVLALDAGTAAPD